jgi:hypothetical protein
VTVPITIGAATYFGLRSSDFGLQKKPTNDNLAEWNNGNIFANRFMKNK